MRLTMQTDFALRTLMYLAATARRATVGQVADQFGISTSLVAKAVNQLARLGYVRGVRGVGGGIELAKPPEQMKLGDVIERLEGNLHLLECVGTERVCAIQSFCKLKTALADAERAQWESLNRLTLRDVAPTTRQFARVDVT